LSSTFRLQGRDFGIGPRIGLILLQAGLENVHTHAHVFRTDAGDVDQTRLLGIMDAARPLVIDTGVRDDRTFDQLSAATRAHLERVDTTTAFAMWQAWGQRPQ
jgi:hypothetical protein